MPYFHVPLRLFDEEVVRRQRINNISVEKPHEFRGPSVKLVAGGLESEQDCTILPSNFCVSELASQSVGAAAIFPEAVAFPVLGAGVGGHLDQFVLAVGEPALPFVGAGAHLLEGLAELCFVLEDVGLGWVELFVSFGAAVFLAGSPRSVLEVVHF